VESPIDGYVSSRGPSQLDKFYDSSHGSSYDRSTVKVYIPSRTSTQTTQELLSSHGSSYDRSTVKVYIPSRTSTQTTQELLYVTLGVVLGSSLLTLIVVMFVCSWRHRQRQRILGSY